MNDTASRGKRRGLMGLFVVGAMLFTTLGAWQAQRLAWKRELIARVEARVHAPPVDVPPAAEWSRLQPRETEYRRVRIRGTFDHRRETLVDALTERGAGAWLMTPLRSREGTILINRGFVPEQRDRAPSDLFRPAGETTVTGLMRVTEPEGRILRPNDAAADRWFSRDVQAIARKRDLGEVAPFFIDAEAGDGTSIPVGGLTIVRFRNAHLAYAATWFALAILCLAGLNVLRKGARRPA